MNKFLILSVLALIFAPVSSVFGLDNEGFVTPDTSEQPVADEQKLAECKLLIEEHEGDSTIDDNSQDLIDDDDADENVE